MAALFTLVATRDDGLHDLVRRADAPPPGSGACVHVSPAHWAVVSGPPGGPLTLGPGRHEVPWADGYEAWFVSRRVFPDIRWGTREPVLYRDREFGEVPLRAHGRCAVSVLRPADFVHRVVRAAGCATTEDVEDRLREAIAAGLGEAMAGLGLRLADLCRAGMLLAAALAARVAPEIAALGLALPDLRVAAITPPEDVARELEARAARPAGTPASASAPSGAAAMVAAARPHAAACRACGDSLPPGARFCPGCGHARGGDPCRDCGAAQTCDARFCPGCGAAVPR